MEPRLYTRSHVENRWRREIRRSSAITKMHGYLYVRYSFLAWQACIKHATVIYELLRRSEPTYRRPFNTDRLCTYITANNTLHL